MVNNLYPALGLLVLICGTFLLDRSKSYPGWWALVPTIGTVLVIRAPANCAVNRNVMGRALVWLGLISYPLYLWHWPIFSFLKIILGHSITAPIATCAVLAAILLSWLTTRFVEAPFRYGKKWVRGRVAALIIGTLAIGGLGGVCYFKEGFPERQVNHGFAKFWGAFRDCSVTSPTCEEIYGDVPVAHLRH